MHYFLLGKGVISEFSYSLDNREVHQPHTLLFPCGLRRLRNKLLNWCRISYLLVIHLSLFCYLLRNIVS